MPKTSDDIRTMSNARASSWSARKCTSFCERIKDSTRLKRNETALKRRKLRRENLAIIKKTRQLETFLNLDYKDE
jgi:hypothetical protein